MADRRLQINLDHFEVRPDDPRSFMELLNCLVDAGARAVYANPRSGTLMLNVEGMGIEAKTKPIDSPIGLVTNDINGFKSRLDELGISVDKLDEEKRIVWFEVGGVLIHCLERADENGNVKYVDEMDRVDPDTGLALS